MPELTVYWLHIKMNDYFGGHSGDHHLTRSVDLEFLVIRKHTTTIDQTLKYTPQSQFLKRKISADFVNRLSDHDTT